MWGSHRVYSQYLAWALSNVDFNKHIKIKILHKLSLSVSLTKMGHCYHHHLQNSKPSSMRVRPHHHRPKANVNWSSGGPGMQAIFLDSSSQRSCGTGVFLPQRAGSNSHKTKKPGSQ